MLENLAISPPNLTENPPPVPETTVDNHNDANRYFFQKLRVIRIPVACGFVLNPPQPPAGFHQLRLARLTPEQIGKVGQAMNDAHGANGVMKYTEGSPQLLATGNKPHMSVTPQRLENIVLSDIDGALKMIHQKVAGGPPLPASEDINSGPLNPISAEAVDQINRHCQDPKNRVEIRLMQESARLIKCLFDEESSIFIRRISYLWLASFKHEKMDRALLDIYQDPDSRRYIGQIYNPKTGEYTPESFMHFLDDIQSFAATPTHQTAENDVIFRIIKRVIETDVKRASLPMPFGLEYAKDES